MTVTTYNPTTGEQILRACYEDVNKLDLSDVPIPSLCRTVRLLPQVSAEAGAGAGASALLGWTTATPAGPGVEKSRA
jgi:hypothetical protein